MNARDARARLLAEATHWPGVTARTHRFGGTALMLGGRELSRVHADLVVDVEFPRAVRDEVILSGAAEAHTLFPHSGWVSRPVRTDADVDAALALLKRSFDLARNYGLA
jgi:hypothetical protein